MPSPGGMDDPGGNPLQEGIWGSIDGGWANRMKRDESFASVHEGDYDPWKSPPRDPEVLRSMWQENPRAFQSLVKKHPWLAGLVGHEVGVNAPHSEEWLGNPGQDAPWQPGIRGRGLIDEEGQLHTWPEDGPLHEEYKDRHGITIPHVEFNIDEDGNVEHDNLVDLGPYLNQLQAKGLKYEDLHDPFAHFNFDLLDRHDGEEEPMPKNDVTASNREKIYLPWSRETSSVENDFEVEQVIPPGPHTEEVDYGDSTPLILQHDDPQLLDNAKEKLEAKVAQWQALLGLLGAGGEGAAAAGAGEAAGGAGMMGGMGNMGGSGLISGLVRGALGHGAAGGAPPAQEYPPPQPYPLSSIHSRLTAFDGPFDNHPSSDQELNERASGDPEDADPHEINDGSHDHWQQDNDINDQGGTDSLTPEDMKVLEDAAPALIHYFNSEESGQDDPAIQRLIELLERDHPGLLDQEPSDEELEILKNLKTSADAGQMGVPGIGGMPANPMMAQPQQPQQVAPQTQASCPHCGARLTGGGGICPQCNGSVSLTPNAPDPANQGVYPPGQQPMPTQPGVIARQAANQGPHNPEQFKAVADYLRQNGQEDQLQDLIDHPENYGDILAQIQGKGQPPQPDPDPGPPPPMPPMPPGGGMPPGMPPGGMPPGGGGMPMMAAADPVTPPCPKCDSHTTGLISDEGLAQCANCKHKWKTEFEPQGEKTPVQPKAGAAEHHMDYPGHWLTTSGDPLEVGQEYEMKSAKYDIPDIVRIESVKPEEIEYTLTGPYNLAHRTAVSKEEAELDGLTFEPAGPDEADNLNEYAPNDQMEAPSMAPVTAAGEMPFNNLGPVYPEEHALQSENFPGEGRNSPYVTCPGCGILTRPTLGGCPNCNTPFGDPPRLAAMHRAMTARDFRLLAEIISRSPTQEREALANHFATELMNTNVRFDRERFIQAALGQPGGRDVRRPDRDYPPDNRPGDLTVPEQFPPGPDEPGNTTFPSHWGHTAGKKYTPMEQRDFIDEPGVARNSDKLDLEGTHYTEQPSLTDDLFLFGL